MSRDRLRRLVGSLRFRITAVATIVVALALAAAGVVAVVAQRRVLTDNLEERLGQQADVVAESVAVGDTLPDPLPSGGDDDVAQLLAPDRTVLGASAALRGEPAVVDDPDEADGYRTISIPEVDDEDFRVLVRPVDTVEGPATLIVGAGTDDIAESVAVLAVTLGITLPLLLLLLAGVVWVVVGRALRPVEAIRAEVEHIGEGELNRRVPVPPSRDEIGRLAETMNAMLGRLESAQQRQRRFVSDASHELRSPLTGIRSELEVDLRDPQSADLVATHRSVLDQTLRLQRLVTDLLMLARADGPSPMRTGTLVDLDDVVLREARDRRDLGAVVDTSRVWAAQVAGDAGVLHSVVRNLLDNACHHARSRVAVELWEEGGHAVLVVDDDGPGIAPGQRARVFERFARLDEARDRDSGGTGLGLAIVRDVVERHGGTVACEGAPSGGARFVVRLPSTEPR